MSNDDKKEAADRLLALIETYGVNPDRWPAAERWRRDELDLESHEVRASLDEQGRLDEVLDGATDVLLSQALLRKVAEIPLRHPRPSPGWIEWPLGRLRNVLALGAAIGALGMVVGMTVSDAGSQEDAVGSWDELSSLAFAADMSEEAVP